MRAEHAPQTIASEPCAPVRLHRRGWAQALAASALLAGCTGGTLDLDLRPRTDGALSTTMAARNPAQARPLPDARGIISYPGYQVVVAGRSETVAEIAQRLGLSPEALGSANAIKPETRLQGGELLVLPGRIAEAGATGTAQIEATTLPSTSEVSLAAPAGPARQPAPAAAKRPASSDEPLRHKVGRGETAWSIARLYGVNVRALAEWNGLDSEYRLRQGQTLLIPPADAAAPPAAAQRTSRPGEGTRTPEPPSAAKPLPVAAAPVAAAPAAPAVQPTPSASVPDLGATRTEASGARFVMPAEGRIIRPYEKGTNEGIGIAAAAGSPVRAAADGTVAAITRDTEQVPIIVLRHADNLLTVYANVEGIAVDKDQRISRGQTIAAVRAGSPAFLHFEVRRGFESVDPMPFLK